MKNKWPIVPIVILLVLIIAEIWWYVPYTRPQTAKIIVAGNTQSGNISTIKYRLQAKLPLNATITIIPVAKRPEDLPVYVYYDENYPVIGTYRVTSRMLWEQIKAQLWFIGYQNEVKQADAAALETIMSENRRAIVVMASGAFPANLFSREVNLVTPWLSGGGILVWFGWNPGYYTVDYQQAEPVVWGLPNQMRGEGIKKLGLDRFFEVTGIAGHPKDADTETAVSRALGISFNLVQQSPQLDAVLGAGGMALGSVGGNVTGLRSSISMIPLGEGKLVIFGFFPAGGWTLNGVGPVGVEVARILGSGILDAASVINIFTKDYDLARYQTVDDSIDINISNSAGYVIFGFNKADSSGLFLYRQFYSSGE
jgi:hypothetical protein